MRTTVTLAPDVEALPRASMIERDLSLPAALNEALRVGLIPPRVHSSRSFTQRTFHMGWLPDVHLDKAPEAATSDEDGALVDRLDRQ